MYCFTRLAASALCLAALVTLGATACDAAPEGPLLFRDTAPQPATPPPDGPRLVRARYVEVDFGVLGGENPAPATAPATILLNLFPDATLTAERDSAQPTGTGRGLIWTGHLVGVPGSAVTLVAEDGVLVGNVQAADRFYEVRYAGDGLHRIAETNPRTFGPD
jgi:hypothetical protein